MIYICEECKSTDVEQKQWVNPNTGDLGDLCSDAEATDSFCNNCEKHVNIICVKNQPILSKHTVYFLIKVETESSLSLEDCIEHLSQENDYSIPSDTTVRVINTELIEVKPIID